LFGTKTGYEALDEKIAKTRENKAGLLAVLRHPEVPLHNNASELNYPPAKPGAYWVSASKAPIKP
jgi:hypothetical protein